MGRTTFIDNKSIEKIANATKELVKLNKATDKQTKVMIRLTWSITILTIVMVILILIQIFCK